MLNEFKTDVNQIKELQTNENDFGIGWWLAKESTQVEKDKNKDVWRGVKVRLDTYFWGTKSVVFAKK
jgi:hypothetical protein